MRIVAFMGAKDRPVPAAEPGNVGGETAAAELSARLDGSKVDAVKSLTYRLFVIADRKKWTEEALAFNALIASWSDVQQQAGEMVSRPKQQVDLF